MANLQIVNDSTFQAEVLQSDLPVLVDFYADWCGPCKALAPVIDRIAERFSGKLKVVKLNTDDSPNAPRDYQVRGIPTLILFQGGEAVDKKVGFVNDDDLTKFLEKHAVGV